MAYGASSDPDVLYMHEALQQPDREEFLVAMKKEINAQITNGNRETIERRHVPEGTSMLPAVWAMRRKQRIADGQVYKWKARLNVDGGKQIKGVNYWETYAPVATWSSIRLIMSMAARKGWMTRQMDFVQAYPQAPVETDLFMEVPRGFHIGADKGKYVQTIVKNIQCGTII
jgi:Reverse transcriptase (RNA-dependent DNA polymerase)